MFVKTYKSPTIKTYSSDFLVETFGPTQTAYADVQIRATAFNTNTEYNRFVEHSQTKLAKAKIISIKDMEIV